MSPRQKSRPYEDGKSGLVTTVDANVNIGSKWRYNQRPFMYASGTVDPPGFEEREPGLVDYDLMVLWLRAC
jgi:hypothetical protein